jgi:hypothetical protein
MSLHIDTQDIFEVLLADGWHQVEDESFILDAYEFHQSDFEFIGIFEHGMAGARWMEKGREGIFINCPISSILAVRADRIKGLAREKSEDAYKEKIRKRELASTSR